MADRHRPCETNGAQPSDTGDANRPTCRLPKSFSKTGRWASGVRAMDRNVPRTRSEGAIEAPESGSLRSAAEQGELLSERQVLEREVGAGPERRAQGAQESECEGHCGPWLARRWPIVQSWRTILANDTRHDPHAPT